MVCDIWKWWNFEWNFLKTLIIVSVNVSNHMIDRFLVKCSRQVHYDRVDLNTNQHGSTLIAFDKRSLHDHKRKWTTIFSWLKVVFLPKIALKTVHKFCTLHESGNQASKLNFVSDAFTSSFTNFMVRWENVDLRRRYTCHTKWQYIAHITNPLVTWYRSKHSQCKFKCHPLPKNILPHRKLFARRMKKKCFNNRNKRSKMNSRKMWFMSWK